MADTPQEKLFESFDPVSKESWKEKIIKDLKGKEFESLIWKSGEGIELEPFYRQEDIKRSEFGRDSLPGEFPHRRGNHFNASNESWQVVQEIPVESGDIISSLVQDALNNEVYAFQLSGKAEVEDVEKLFEQLDFDQTAFHFSFPNVPALLSLDLYTTLNAKGIKADLLTGTLLNDPISLAAAQGRPIDHADFAMVEAGVNNFKASPWFRGVGLDFSYIHEQGGTITQQIAFALSTVVEYLDLHGKTLSNIHMDEIFRNLSFTFSVGNNFFLEIAKFRAFRMLFAKLASVYGVHDAKLASPFIIGKTSGFYQNVYDSYNNLLRNTTSAISGIFGGVQAMVVRPFDSLTEESNPTSARLARNIQHLLRHESHLDQVIDPAGGSYYVEKATDALGEAAWKLFQEIENRGGFSSMVSEGAIQQLIGEARKAKEAALNSQKEAIIGLNVSPNTSESLEMDFEQDGRLANSFEKIRLHADSLGNQRGKRLSAFLLLFGDAKMRNARAQFARNLLGSGGFEIKENTRFDDIIHSLEEAANSEAEVLVLCASNIDYQNENKSICDQLKAMPSQPIVIQAGKTENWEECGVEEVIYARMDVVAFLEELIGQLA
ncbi:MAG: methylmalonyl-CoA mutase family protein [Bacteroidia bacterium]|nr:methylmalonyl-CoA mutase family protein [Bacteroidia bacterium]